MNETSEKRANLSETVCVFDQACWVHKMAHCFADESIW